MRRRLIILIPIYAMTLICLVWVFHGVDISALKQNLAAVAWPYLLIAAILNVSIYFANAWRWKLLLSPVAPVRFRRSLDAIYIGLFLNDVLPLRPGEIARCGLLSRWTRDVHFTDAISSAMIERFFEFVLLAAGFFFLMLFTPMPKALVYGCAIATAVVAGITVSLILIVRHHRKHANNNEPQSEAGRVGKLRELWYRFVNGLHLMGNPRTMVLVSAMSVVALFLNILAAWTLMKACGIFLPLAVAAAVLIIIRVGTAIPTTPGSVGAYQFFSVFALELFGVNKTVAAAFTLVAFAAFTFPLLVGGAIALIFAGSGVSGTLLLSRQLPSGEITASETR